MAETLTKSAKSQDAEKGQEKRKRPEPAPEHEKALADESIPFPGLLGVSAMEPPIEGHAAFLGDPRFSHPANNTQKARMVTNLQGAYGNQYVQRLVESLNVQAKLTVSSPDDQYEREADRVADTVTRASASSIQRQAEEEEEEEEEPIQNKLTSDVQVKRQAEEPEEEDEEPIQTKLTNDIQVLRQAEEPEEEEEEEEPIQTKLTDDIQVQRQAEEPEEEEDEPIQTERVGGQIPLIGSSLQSRINSLKGGGQPLPESARRYFEPRFGSSFNDVRIHDNSQAADIAKSINAKAFTKGQDIVFGAGQYSPETSEGKYLLAHELAHVVQQEGVNRLGKKSKPENVIRKDKLRPENLTFSSDRQAQIRLWFLPRIDTHPKWLDDRRIVVAPTGLKYRREYRFELFETTPDAVVMTAASKGCDVLRPALAKRFEALVGLSTEKYAPLYKPGRFYRLKPIDARFTITMEVFFRNLRYLMKKQERLKKVMQQIKSAEPQLMHAFGQAWPRVKKILIRKGPFTRTPLTNVNFKVKLAEPTAIIRARMIADKRFSSTFRIKRLKAEQGWNIERAGATSWIGIDLVNNTIFYDFVSVRYEPRTMTFKKTQGDCSFGASVGYFVPFSSGATWKIGCEKKSKFISIGSGPYKWQTYIEYSAEGDLTISARFTYGLLEAIFLLACAALLAPAAAPALAPAAAAA
jgi:hypothetical protein